jgi:general secretion pathway protein D
MTIRAVQWIAAVCLTWPALAVSISLQPSSLMVIRGQSFSLDVNVSSITDLYAFQFDLSFPGGLLSAVSISEGPLLPSAGTSFFVPGIIDPEGTISFTADTLLGPIPGVSGSEILATVQFDAIAPGTGPITLSNVTLLDSALAEIPATIINSSVTVRDVPGVTPEPATWVLSGVGIILLPGIRRYLLRHCAKRGECV